MELKDSNANPHRHYKQQGAVRKTRTMASSAAYELSYDDVVVAEDVDTCIKFNSIDHERATNKLGAEIRSQVTVPGSREHNAPHNMMAKRTVELVVSCLLDTITLNSSVCG
jgi:hypothetical protein